MSWSRRIAALTPYLLTQNFSLRGLSLSAGPRRVIPEVAKSFFALRAQDGDNPYVQVPPRIFQQPEEHFLSPCQKAIGPATGCGAGLAKPFVRTASSAPLSSLGETADKTSGQKRIS